MRGVESLAARSLNPEEIQGELWYAYDARRVMWARVFNKVLEIHRIFTDVKNDRLTNRSYLLYSRFVRGWKLPGTI
jgi:hypothetical protein